jgi:hypothetical protein
MKRVSTVLLASFFLLSTAVASNAATIVLNQVSDGGGSSVYICQLGSYQAYFTYDLSAIPDTAIIDSATFGASMSSSGAAERTIWSGSTLMGKAMIPTTGSTTSYAWGTIGVFPDFDWSSALATDTLVLMLTGPENGAHICGRVEQMASGNLTELTLSYDGTTSVPEPGSALLLLLGVGMAGLNALRRRSR